MMGTIEQRLEVLEFQIRRTQRVNRVLLFALIAVFCIAGAQGTTPAESKQKTSKATHARSPRDGEISPGNDHLRTVEADQFVLLDRFGRSRAKMAVTDQGPALCMFDRKGQKKLELTQTTNGSGLHLLDANESAVVSLQVPRDAARAHLEIRSPQGSSLTKSSGVSIKDRAENQRLLLALTNGDFPVLGISQSGQSGPPSVEITASDDGSRHWKMHDAGGYPLFSVSAEKNSMTYLNMRHPGHQRSLQISAGAKESDGPEITFSAPVKKDGKVGRLAFLRFGLRKDRLPYIQILDSEGSPIFTAPAE